MPEWFSFPQCELYEKKNPRKEHILLLFPIPSPPLIPNNKRKLTGHYYHFKRLLCSLPPCFIRYTHMCKLLTSMCTHYIVCKSKLVALLMLRKFEQFCDFEFDIATVKIITLTKQVQQSSEIQRSNSCIRMQR